MTASDLSSGMSDVESLETTDTQEEGAYLMFGSSRKTGLSKSKSNIIAKYVGESKKNLKKKIDSAARGVLFIDEAYSLVKSANDFGIDEIHTLMHYRNGNSMSNTPVFYSCWVSKAYGKFFESESRITTKVQY
uniref:Protein cfxQ homolog n=1 Tax=Saccoglossus kowalevskii TaxID=10224 RepID=A0ABM0M3G8_SACKO|nr:PREDICTED: protein cfxQ homolog [Saccoglossus kowalevskii]